MLKKVLLHSRKCLPTSPMMTKLSFALEALSLSPEDLETLRIRDEKSEVKAGWNGLSTGSIASVIFSPLYEPSVLRSSISPASSDPHLTSVQQFW
jgi:hypothetical protein